MKEVNFEKIGRKIRKVRISKGLTQEYVANVANVNVSHISNIENNRVKISLTTLIQVCNALQTTVDYILLDEYTSSGNVLDNEILHELQSCTPDTKNKILQIIKILS